jgi:hypothetical protein
MLEMSPFREWLQKLARRLRSGAAVMNALATMIDALIALFGGPGFGFAAG